MTTPTAPDTKREELLVATACAISAALFAPDAAIPILAMFVFVCWAASRYARTLRCPIGQQHRATQPPVALAPLPRIDASLPRTLLASAIRGDVIAESQLRILGRLYAHDSALGRAVAEVDARSRARALG